MRFAVSLSAVVLSVVMLTGCAAQDHPTPPSPSPTPTVSVATEKEVSSIIAGLDPAARKVIDDAFECRMLAEIPERDYVEEATLMDCYIREMTIGLSSASAARELRKLEIPAGMQGLVDETLEVLDEIRAIDLQAECGDVRPNIDDKDCTSALHKRKLSYWTLETVLDKWSPYIA